MSLPLTRRIARAALLIAAGAAPVVGAAGSASAMDLPQASNLGGLSAVDAVGVGDTADNATQSATDTAGDTGSKTVKKAVPTAGKTVGKTTRTATPAAQKAAGDAAGNAGEVLGETAGTATEGTGPVGGLGGGAPEQLPVKSLPLG